MTDFILQTADQDTMIAAYKALGYWNEEAQTPILSGPLPGDEDPNSGYVLIEVGTVEGGEGFCAILRINGVNPFLTGVYSVPAGVTVYSLVTPAPFWSADGSTPGPEWINRVGVIA